MKFAGPAACLQLLCRTPRGVRGLKSPSPMARAAEKRRTPRGVRGLKFKALGVEEDKIESHPSRGAWIEIKAPASDNRPGHVAPLAGCVD